MSVALERRQCVGAPLGRAAQTELARVSLRRPAVQVVVLILVTAGTSPMAVAQSVYAQELRLPIVPFAPPLRIFV
jgi:hypothetical protein